MPCLILTCPDSAVVIGAAIKTLLNVVLFSFLIRGVSISMCIFLRNSNRPQPEPVLKSRAEEGRIDRECEGEEDGSMCEVGNSEEETQERASFLSPHSLPVVKKSFPFAETLALSFLQPMEVVTLTSKGVEIINEKESISVHVADDTVPVGRILHLELGSSMHGRLSFPTNVSPVSPILWICPQEDIPLQKPIKITLPNKVKYEEGTTESMFMKAHHETPLIMPTSLEYTFKFEEIVDHEGVEFNERKGLIYIRQFCPVCIAQKISKPSPKKYLLLRTQPKNNTSSTFSIDYCVILPTYLEVRIAASCYMLPA